MRKFGTWLMAKFAWQPHNAIGNYEIEQNSVTREFRWRYIDRTEQHWNPWRDGHPPPEEKYPYLSPAEMALRLVKPAGRGSA